MSKNLCFAYGSNLNQADWFEWCRNHGFTEKESRHEFTFRKIGHAFLYGTLRQGKHLAGYPGDSPRKSVRLRGRIYIPVFIRTKTVTLLSATLSPLHMKSSKPSTPWKGGMAITRNLLATASDCRRKSEAVPADAGVTFIIARNRTLPLYDSSNPVTGRKVIMKRMNVSSISPNQNFNLPVVKEIFLRNFKPPEPKEFGRFLKQSSTLAKQAGKIDLWQRSPKRMFFERKEEND